MSESLKGWLDLRRAADYLCLSIRTLRTYIGHHEHPLPVRRVGGKLLGRVMDFDRWAQSFPEAGAHIDQLVDEILSEIENGSSR